VASAKAFFGEAVEEAAAPPPKPARSAAKPTAVAQGPSESRAPQPQPAPAAALPHPLGLGPPLAQRFLHLLLRRLGLQLRRTEWVDKHVPRRISEATAAARSDSL
jgi:hypothetical protein